jgi:hypothetical protein
MKYDISGRYPVSSMGIVHVPEAEGLFRIPKERAKISVANMFTAKAIITLA